MSKKSRFGWLEHPAFFMGMVMLGAVTGGFIPNAADWLNPVLKIYINLLNLFIFPLIILSIIFGLAQFSALPRSPQRFLMAVGLGVLGLLICGLIAALVGLVFAPGQGISEQLRSMIGNLSLTRDPVLTLSYAQPVTDISSWVPGQFIPSNIFYALAYQSLAFGMVASVIFGFGFTFLPSAAIKSLFEHLEVVYIALENLISIVNKSLPVVAGIFAVNIFSSIGQGWFGLVTGFLLPFMVAIVLAGLLDFLIIAYVAEFKLLTVMSALARSLVISFLARNPAAGVPEVIECLCDGFGFKRSLVRFLAPLFPIFFNAGEVIFFTLLSVFVANVYDLTLTWWSLLQILSLSVVCTFVSTTLVGGGAVVMATFMLQAFKLPFDALLPAFFVLEIFLAGAKSALSLMFACAVISLVSLGLSRDARQLDEAPQESTGNNRLLLTIDKKMLLLVYGLFALFLATVFVIGLGVGARSVQVPPKHATHSKTDLPMSAQTQHLPPGATVL